MNIFSRDTFLVVLLCKANVIHIACNRFNHDKARVKNRSNSWKDDEGYIDLKICVIGEKVYHYHLIQ